MQVNNAMYASSSLCFSFVNSGPAKSMPTTSKQLPGEVLSTGSCAVGALAARNLSFMQPLQVVTVESRNCLGFES